MRRTNLPALCVVIGVLLARPCGSAVAQPPPDPTPVNTGPPSVLVPTTFPYQGMPPAPAPQMTPPAPQANAPAPPAMTAPQPWPNPNGPVAPVNPASPPMPARLLMANPQPKAPQGMMAAAGAPGFAPIHAVPVPAVQAPSVHVEKRGPEVVNLNKMFSYEIIVRNTGPVPVAQVRVEDELPTGARYVGGEPMAEVGANRLGWSLGTLEPSAERRLRVDVQPLGEGELRGNATVTFSATAGLRTQVVQPRLVLAMRGPEQALVGDPVPFQITVSNPGTGPVTNLLLRGKLPEGLQHSQGAVVEAELGVLAPGEARTVTLTTAAAKGGRQAVEIAASGEGGLETNANTAVMVLGPVLQLQRGGPAKCYVKGEVGLEMELANAGSAAAGYVEVVDTLPAGLEFVAASDAGAYDPAARTITWRLAALPPGGRQRLGYRVKAVTVGEQVERTLVRADRGSEVRAESTFTVEGIPALLLEVVDLEDPIEIGGELTYEVRVVNQGSCPCTNIQITATVPDGLQAHEATGPSAYKVQGAQVVFEPLPKLATKADVVYRIKVRGRQPGDYRFKVQMTCEQLSQPVYKEEASRVYKNGQ